MRYGSLALRTGSDWSTEPNDACGGETLCPPPQVYQVSCAMTEQAAAMAAAPIGSVSVCGAHGVLGLGSDPPEAAKLTAVVTALAAIRFAVAPWSPAPYWVCAGRLYANCCARSSVLGGPGRLQTWSSVRHTSKYRPSPMNPAKAPGTFSRPSRPPSATAAVPVLKSGLMVSIAPACAMPIWPLLRLGSATVSTAPMVSAWDCTTGSCSADFTTCAPIE